MENFIKGLVLGAAALVFGACSYDDLVDDVPEGPVADNGVRFGISIGADSASGAGASATRAEYDGVNYKWSPGDQVGFFMAYNTLTVPVLSNVRLKGTNTEASQWADFAGELSQPQLMQIQAGGRYDYYSYYPYTENLAGAAFPNVPFTIPGEITLTPDVFPAEYGFMYGGKVTTPQGQKPISWLDGDGQQFGETVSFNYRHAFAWLEVYLAVNLMSKPIGKVVITCKDGSAMSGTAHINMETGAVNFVSGQSSAITVKIDGGMDVNNGRVWVPINPALAGKQFDFEFYTTDGFLIDAAQTVNGGALAAGKKHKAKFLLPFFVDFSKDASGSGKTFYSFGHTITTNQDTVLSGGALELEGSTTVNNRDAFKLPLLNTAVSSDYPAQSRYVMVKIEALFDTGTWFSKDNYRTLHYNVTDASTYTISDSSSPSFWLETSYTVLQSANPVFQISDNTYITFRCRIPTGLSYQRIKRVWVYPRFDY